MTVTFLTDQQNDLYLDADGNIAMGRDIVAVMSVCDAVAETTRGECVFDVELGLPNFETVWNGVPNIPQWETAYRANIMAIDNVAEVVSLDTVVEDGQLKYEAVISTTFGTGVTNG